MATYKAASGLNKGVTGGLSTGTAPAPTYAAAPKPSLPPVQTGGDSRYNLDIANLQQNYNNANLGYQQRETDTRSLFGFDPQYADNPYTRANLLQRSADQRFRGSTNSMAARGQLYSGALDRAHAADTFTSGAELDTARRDYASQLNQLSQDRLGAQTQYTQGIAGAYQDLLDRRIAAEPDPSQFDPGGSAGPSPTDIAKAQNILANKSSKTQAAINWAKSILHA